MLEKIYAGFRRVKNFVSGTTAKVVTAVVGGVTAVSAITAKSAIAASDPQIDAMFAAVDLTSLKTQVATLLMATILIPLMFVGARLVKKSIRQAN